MFSISVWTTEDKTSFDSFLNQLDERIIRENIKLVVIDSIAAIVRGVRMCKLTTLSYLIVQVACYCVCRT